MQPMVGAHVTKTFFYNFIIHDTFENKYLVKSAVNIDLHIQVLLSMHKCIMYLPLVFGQGTVVISWSSTGYVLNLSVAGTLYADIRKQEHYKSYPNSEYLYPFPIRFRRTAI